MAFKVILGLCHPNSYLSKERAGKARLNTMNLHQAEEICLPHVYTAPRPSERHHRHPPHALPKLSDTLKKIPLKKKKKHKKKQHRKQSKKKTKNPKHHQQNPPRSTAQRARRCEATCFCAHSSSASSTTSPRAKCFCGALEKPKKNLPQHSTAGAAPGGPCPALSGGHG